MKYIVPSIVPTGDSSKLRIQSISNAVWDFPRESLFSIPYSWDVLSLKTV
jgi:hypothetical protein